MIVSVGVNKGPRRSGAPSPAVVGIARSMRARDVSRPRPADPEPRRGQESPDTDPDADSGNGGSTPDDS